MRSRGQQARRVEPGTADESFAGQPEQALADSEVRPDPGSRRYARTTARPRKQGRAGSITHILPADSVPLVRPNLRQVTRARIGPLWRGRQRADDGGDDFLGRAGGIDLEPGLLAEGLQVGEL
jgi:hypothetical protein